MRALAITAILAGCGGSHESAPARPLPPADAGAPTDTAPIDAATDAPAGADISPNAPNVEYNRTYGPATGRQGGPESLGTGRIDAPSTTPPVGTVAVGMPSGTSGMDPEVIRRVIRVHRGLLLRCYKLELDREPKAAGVVVAKLEWGAGGAVTAATASGIAPELETCLAKTFTLWRFPQAVGTSKITVPLTFSPP